MKEPLREACSRTPVAGRYTTASEVERVCGRVSAGGMGRFKAEKWADAMYRGEYVTRIQNSGGALSREFKALLVAGVALIVSCLHRSPHGN